MLSFVSVLGLASEIRPFSSRLVPLFQSEDGQDNSEMVRCAYFKKRKEPQHDTLVCG